MDEALRERLIRHLDSQSKFNEGMTSIARQLEGLIKDLDKRITAIEEIAGNVRA